MERMQRTNDEMPLSDNRSQIELAKFSFHREHPEITTPSNNEIMSAWVGEHSADYRKVVEKDPSAMLKPGDQSALAMWYERILAQHDAGTETAH